MYSSRSTYLGLTMFLGLVLPLSAPSPAACQLSLRPEQFVQADGADIVVSGYSVPSFVYWDSDDLRDLVVGEGSGSATPKVRVYLNIGTQSNPQFTNAAPFSFYAQSGGGDLTVPGGG